MKANLFRKMNLILGCLFFAAVTTGHAQTQVMDKHVTYVCKREDGKNMMIRVFSRTSLFGKEVPTFVKVDDTLIGYTPTNDRAYEGVQLFVSNNSTGKPQLQISGNGLAKKLFRGTFYGSQYSPQAGNLDVWRIECSPLAE